MPLRSASRAHAFIISLIGEHLKTDVLEKEKMMELKQSICDGRSDYYLIAIAGKLGLYERVTWNSGTRPRRSYKVCWSDGSITGHSDRPSIEFLRERQYDVPKDTPGRWTTN